MSSEASTEATDHLLRRAAEIAAVLRGAAGEAAGGAAGEAAGGAGSEAAGGGAGSEAAGGGANGGGLTDGVSVSGVSTHSISGGGVSSHDVSTDGVSTGGVSAHDVAALVEDLAAALAAERAARIRADAGREVAEASSDAVQQAVDALAVPAASDLVAELPPDVVERSRVLRGNTFGIVTAEDTDVHTKLVQLALQVPLALQVVEEARGTIAHLNERVEHLSLEQRAGS